MEHDNEFFRRVRRVLRDPPKACGGAWNKAEIRKVGALALTDPDAAYVKLLEQRLAKLWRRRSQRPSGGKADEPNR